MTGRMSAVARLAAVCLAALTGCRAFERFNEPPNHGFLREYGDLEPGSRFKKLRVEPGVSVRGFTKVRIPTVEVAEPVGMEWTQEFERDNKGIAVMVLHLRIALEAELATSFEILPDDSLVDDRTIVVRPILTRMTRVEVPQEPGAQAAASWGLPAVAAAEIAVWKGLSPYPFIKIKDWRAGRQRLNGPGESGPGDFGAVVTIFRFWGERLTELLVELRAQPGAETGALP